MRNRETWLVDQLDNNELTVAVREAYEAELDAIAERQNRTEAKRKEAEVLEEQRRANIRALLLANDQDIVGTLGMEEFGDDYELVTEGSDFILYSKVARDGQDHRRVHASADLAHADLRYLVWNRLYSKYVRTGDVDNIGELAS